MNKKLRNLLFNEGVWYKAKAPCGHRLRGLAVGWASFYSRCFGTQFHPVVVGNWTIIFDGCNDPSCQWSKVERDEDVENNTMQ